MSKQEIYIGIDPGKKGAIVAYNPERHFTEPFIGKLWPKKDNLNELIDYIKDLSQEYQIRLALMERVVGRPGQGSPSVFSFGANFGMWIGILTTLEIPFDFIYPAKWNAMILHQRKKAKLSVGVALIRQFAHVRPHIEKLILGPRKGFLDGMADAAAIAYCSYLISRPDEKQIEKVIKRRRKK